MDPSSLALEWPESWITNGFLTEVFDIDKNGLRRWTDPSHREGTQDQSGFMMLTLEIWGQLFILGRRPDDITGELLERRAK